MPVLRAGGGHVRFLPPLLHRSRPLVFCSRERLPGRARRCWRRWPCHFSGVASAPATRALLAQALVLLLVPGASRFV
eukprot:10168605-Alexandrium_andersonii.AAC.1